MNWNYRINGETFRIVINRAIECLGLNGSFLFTKKGQTFLNHNGIKEFHGCEVISAKRVGKQTARQLAG